jgi:hypothetical protein
MRHPHGETGDGHWVGHRLPGHLILPWWQYEQEALEDVVRSGHLVVKEGLVGYAVGLGLPGAARR